MPHYTQILARTTRPTQILGSVKDLDAYLFPHGPAGQLICERTSEAMDVRISVQVARGISRVLGRGPAVLALAGEEEGDGFWCELFDGGVPRFQHNRLTGPSGFAPIPASREEVETLCRCWGAEESTDAVHAILTGGGYESARARHAALAEALGFPAASAGIGYSRAREGGLPPAVGTPRRAPRSLEGIRPIAEWYRDLAGLDPLARFQATCERAFRFLEEDFGFRREPGPYAVDVFPEIVGNVKVIGPGNVRPGYQNAFLLSYRSPHLLVVIQGLSQGGRTQLCLLDRKGRDLSLTALVERRNPELLDLCRLAQGQSEQIPMYAEALQKCAADLLAGDLTAISTDEPIATGFSFTAFTSPVDRDYVLTLYGPRFHPRTIAARIRRLLLLRRTKADVRQRQLKKAGVKPA